MKSLQTIAGVFDVNDFHLAQIRKIGDVYFPDAALDTHYNHICILKVERSFTMTTTVSACQLPSLEDRPKVRRNYKLHTIISCKGFFPTIFHKEKSRCDFYGWGDSNLKKLPELRRRDKLLTSEMQIVSLKKCMLDWKHLVDQESGNSGRVICAAFPSAPPCHVCTTVVLRNICHILFLT